MFCHCVYICLSISVYCLSLCLCSFHSFCFVLVSFFCFSFLFFLFFFTRCPNGNFPPEIRVAFAQGKPAATESRYLTLIMYTVHAGSSRFRNPPNSDVDDRIFNVRAWSFLCSACTHGGWATPTASQHNMFDSDKLSHFFVLCFWRGSNEPLVFGSRVRRSIIWTTPSP